MSSRYSYVSLFKDPLPLDENGQNSVTVSKVVIPRIQRPYAQGRSIPESDLVRKNFLKDLFEVLEGRKDNLDLNFVYGRLENRRRDGVDRYTMQLLDGQQRLTTLFLLHWYLFNREKVSDQDCVTAINSFSYETRETSAMFCEMLGTQVKSGRFLRFCKEGTHGVRSPFPPRDELRLSLHYVHAFDQDPTVSAMLTMLDAIDKEYNRSYPIGEHGDFWKRLERIRFAVLSLTQYKLSEELYIKMNARGLPLSPFDCFKADFLSLMDFPNIREHAHRLVHLKTGLAANANDDDAVTFKQFFGTKLDCSWCDLFWRREDPSSYDSSYMLFFSRYFAARYLLEHQEISSKEWQQNKQLDILFFHKLHEDDRFHYHGIAPFAAMVEKFGCAVDYFEDITTLLNLLKSRKAELLEAMKPLWQTADYAQPDYFCDGAVRLQQIPLVMLSAVIAFVHEFPACPADLFRVWMKVVNNVVENTNIDNYTPVAATAGKLAQVIRAIAAQKPLTVLEFYRAMATIAKEQIGAAAVEEEIEKACCISSTENGDTPEDWISLFDDIAKHPFFKGMIGFYYSREMSFAAFREHVKLIGSLFGKDGIAEAYRGAHHYLLRAVFAQIQKWNQLAGRYVVEGDAQKYLKNLISSLNDDELRERMHNLFAVKLLGKAIVADGATSPEVEEALREAISEAPAIVPGETWDTLEVLSVLRNDERFYDWAFDQQSLVHVYWHKDQIIGRVPKKWSSVMMAVYRHAEIIANSLDMEKITAVDGRKGYSVKYGMYVGEDCQMRKALPKHPGASVCVRFYAEYNTPYPVEMAIRWPKNSLSKEESEQLRNTFGGEAVGISGDENYTWIGTWTFSASGEGVKTITVEQIKSKVGEILGK